MMPKAFMSGRRYHRASALPICDEDLPFMLVLPFVTIPHFDALFIGSVEENHSVFAFLVCDSYCATS